MKSKNILVNLINKVKEEKARLIAEEQGVPYVPSLVCLLILFFFLIIFFFIPFFISFFLPSFIILFTCLSLLIFLKVLLDENNSESAPEITTSTANTNTALTEPKLSSSTGEIPPEPKPEKGIYN